MGISELNKSQPILNLLAPVDTQAASPQRAFQSPTPGGETCFTGNGTVVHHRFTALTATLDMGDAACMLDELVDVWIVVPLASTQMLFGVGVFSQPQRPYASCSG